MNAADVVPAVTFGPYEVIEACGEYGKDAAVMLVKPDGAPGKFLVKGRVRVAWVFSHYDNNHEEALRIGALFAAAPDLLAALRAIYECSCDGAELPRGHLHVAEIARAAIAKAEGQ